MTQVLLVVIYTMQISKKINICIADCESGEVVGQTKKLTLLSTSENLVGNQLITNWINSFIRGVQNHSHLVIQITADDFELPEQITCF